MRLNQLIQKTNKQLEGMGVVCYNLVELDFGVFAMAR